MGKWQNYKVPFVFATNGRPYLKQIETESGIWYQDLRKDTNIPQVLQGWYSPEELLAKYKQNVDEADFKLSNLPYDFLRDPDGLNLRYYQLNAVEAVEKAVMNGQTRILLAMATGTGKTRTILGMLYRFLKANRFRRILFLVDRTALGEQAQDVFNDVKLEDLQPLNKIYNINTLDDIELATETRIQVATVQGMVARIMNDDKEKIPSSGDFDCIIIDEAHRGYTLDKELSEAELLYRDQNDFISKYKKVIEYFDAVKIGLTATPALHTTQIFGNAVYTYSYREAVIDGYLVDYDAPHIIKTELNQNGIHHDKGEKLARYNPVTKELLNPEELEDEVDFEVEDFNKKVVTPSFNEVVLSEISKYIAPESEEKTLFFAVNDRHADEIVKQLRDIYKEQEIPANAIEKITCAIGDRTRVQDAIKRFKNEHYPTIAVTVDLLSTGIDVPEITKIVFMRRIKSRILYEQMLGRATRLCPKIGKTHFDIFDAVDLNGTKVQRASLVNPNTIRNLKIALGSHIVVVKRGEIIPKIESVLENEENTNLLPIKQPVTCETCGTMLVDEGTRLFCPNIHCEKRVLHQILKWVSVVDIRDFGETLIRSLFADKKLNSISSIYSLTEEILTPYFLNDESISLEKKSLGAKKVALSIQNHRSIPLAKFIAGFDIEGIGETVVEKLISQGYNSLKIIFELSEEQVAQVYGFAEIMAKTFVNGIKENRAEMENLVSSGTIFVQEGKLGGKLEGKSFCFTGELTTMKRADAQNLVKSNGGSVKTSVVKGLSYLVTNDTSSGSAKNAKAATLGIPILNEKEFLALFN